MKKRYIPFLACALLSVPAQAALIAYDGFDYAAGALDGNSGGSGFGGAWTPRAAESGTGGITASWSVLSTGLAFSNLAVTGGRAQGQAPSGNPHAETMRDLSASLSGQIYGSYLYAPNTVPRNLPVAGIQIGAATDGRNQQTVQVFADEYYDFGTEVILGVRSEDTLGGTNQAAGSSLLTLDMTYLVLWSANLINDSPTIDMWVLSSGQFNTFKSGGLTDTELNSAALGTGDSGVWARASVTGTDPSLDLTNNVNLLVYGGWDEDPIGITTSIDELRIGTSLDEVTPLIPEPSASLLGGLGLLGLLRRRR